jgi:hypothetical protein
MEQLILLLAFTTVGMLLMRKFVPYLGEQLWRSYCNVLIWCVKAPFRLARVLLNEVRRRP